MPTILHTLGQNKEDHEMLHDMYRGVYLEGECYAFAIALNQGLGWPLVGLMKEELIWHAGVRSPDGRLHDVRGFLTEEQFSAHFHLPPANLRDICVQDMYAIREVDVYSIKHARRLAEVLWPALPWLNPTASKVIEFADELEALCRKHGFWIIGSVPAQLPRLVMAAGDEGGYEISTAVDGLSYTITRYLEFEMRIRKMSA